MVGSSLCDIVGGGPQLFQSFLGICYFIVTFSFFLACSVGFDRSALGTYKNVVIVEDISEWNKLAID